MIANKSLFALMQDRISINEIIENLEGELSSEVEAALELNKEQLSEKGESYLFVLAQLESFIALNQRYVDQANSNISRAETIINRLRGNLLNAAIAFKEFKAGIHRVTTRKSTAVEITDESKIAEEYKVISISERPDKKLIGDALKSGMTVEGAVLKESIHLSIK